MSRPVVWLKGLVILCGLAVVAGCGGGSSLVPKQRTASAEYSALLALYPENDQALGVEPKVPGLRSEPMTCALVLAAEALHYSANQSEESRRRVRQATLWLLDNSDTDVDGKPGWGLTYPFDAFGDGSTNPANQPYSITTALVVSALQDAVGLRSVWSAAEKARIHALLTRTAVTWCEDAWSPGNGGGFFWYSTSPNDATFVVNASTAMLGAFSRVLRDPGSGFTTQERALVQDCVDLAAQATLASVDMRGSHPFWTYMPPPNAYNRATANDLVHHVYIIWGMEIYRQQGGMHPLPWSTADAAMSLSRFWKDGKLYEYPQDGQAEERLKDRPARLWGLGAALAFTSWKGSKADAGRYATLLLNDYRSYPQASMYPPSFSSDSTFYARFGAHALWGLAERDFR